MLSREVVKRSVGSHGCKDKRSIGALLPLYFVLPWETGPLAFVIGDRGCLDLPEPGPWRAMAPPPMIPQVPTVAPPVVPATVPVPRPLPGGACRHPRAGICGRGP